MDQLERTISEYSDTELVKQYSFHKEEYTETAFALIEKEIKRRNLDVQKCTKEAFTKENIDIKELKDEDFVKFDHYFNKIDLDLAVAILRDNRILFYVDNPTSSDILPTESEASKLFTIHVLAKTADEAHTLLDEHFEKTEGKYRLKNMSTKEQLKAFSFHQVHLDEKEAAEVVDVEFSLKERKLISSYGEYVIKNADEIETKYERVLFYYDVIEALIEKLQDDTDQSFSKTELLAILEILQISCFKDDFTDELDVVVATLLRFFLE